MSAVPPVPTQPVVGSGRPPKRPIVAAAILFAIIVTKPWPAVSAPSPSPQQMSTDASLDEAAVPASAHPNVSPGPDDIACQGGWRLVSISHQANWTIKDWTAVDPRAGPGPVGQNISFVGLTGVVRAIGVCADGQELGNPDRSVAIGGAWRVTDAGGSVTASSIPLEATADAAQPAAFARLYRPLSRDPATAWRPGRYVVELNVAGAIEWLGIVVPAA